MSLLQSKIQRSKCINDNCIRHNLKFPVNQLAICNPPCIDNRNSSLNTVYSARVIRNYYDDIILIPHHTRAVHVFL